MNNINPYNKMALWSAALIVGWLAITAPTVATTAPAGDMAGLAWNQSNISTLKTLDKHTIADLIDSIANPQIAPPISAGSIGTFTWSDLAGDGTYQLVMTVDVSRHFYNALVIYNRDADGKLSAQEIRGWEIGPLSDVIRDLNGDGKNELIIPSQLPCSTYRGAGAVPTWPAVYRLENGHYVEASRDFPNFYLNDILPKLDEQINEARSERVQAWLIMERDNILRVINRNPTSGLRQAYQWMKSGNSELREDAAVVFCEIGGHDKELKLLGSDENLNVASAAKFAMRHKLGSFDRWNHVSYQTIVNTLR